MYIYFMWITFRPCRFLFLVENYLQSGILHISDSSPGSDVIFSYSIYNHAKRNQTFGVQVLLNTLRPDVSNIIVFAARHYNIYIHYDTDTGQ